MSTWGKDVFRIVLLIVLVEVVVAFGWTIHRIEQLQDRLDIMELEVAQKDAATWKFLREQSATMKVLLDLIEALKRR